MKEGQIGRIRKKIYTEREREKETETETETERKRQREMGDLGYDRN